MSPSLQPAATTAQCEAVLDEISRVVVGKRAALTLIYPGRRIEAAVLWTTARSLMDLPDDVLEAALAGR